MRALSPRRIRRNNTSTRKNKENDPPTNPHVGDFHPDHRARLVHEHSINSMNSMISSFEESKKTHRKKDTKSRKQNSNGANRTRGTGTGADTGTPPRPTSKASSRGGLRSRTPTPMRSPLSSTRDPTRRPLQSTTPLAPSFHGSLNHYQNHSKNHANFTAGTGASTKISIVVNSNKRKEINKDRSKNESDRISVRQKRDRRIDQMRLARGGKDEGQFQNQKKLNQSKLANAPNGITLLEDPPEGQVKAPKIDPVFEEAGITPAYAYKDTDSGLLRISIAPPQPHEIQINNGHQGGDTDMSASMSTCSASAISSRSNSLVPASSSTSASAPAPALYPIAINGGGVGVYTDPRTFAKGGINAISENRHQVLRVTGRNISFPWNFGNGTFSSEKNKNVSILRTRKSDDEEGNMKMAVDVSVRGSLSYDREEDLEQGLKKALNGELDDPGENDRFPDDDGGSKVFSPWKIWEAVHNSVVRFREREETIFDNLSGSPDTNGRRRSSGSGISDSDNKVARSLPSRPISSKRKARISSVYNEDDFDFVLVLQPREVYRYWANLLDFREERGYEVRPQSKFLMSGSDKIEARVSGEAKIDYNNSRSNSENSRKRRRNDALAADNQNTNENGNSDFDSDWCNEIPFNIGCGSTRIASVDKRGQRVFTHGTSLFDRAIQRKTPPMTRKPGREGSAESSSTLSSAGNDGEKKTPVRSAARRIRRSLNRFSPNRSKRRLTPRETPPSSTRRRWGNNNAMNSNSRTPFSPPIRALRKTSPKRGGGRNQGTPYPYKDNFYKDREQGKQRKRAKKANPNSLEIEDIPNQLVPRGIAARTARSNGMTEFLWALERGFVVRRHRAGFEPVFVKLISSDGGDTIQYKYIDPGDAHIALKGQNVRYNKSRRRGVYDDPLIPDESAWANIEKDEKDLSQHLFLPDIKKTVVDIATKTLHGGSIRAADVIAVHRATHVNPLSAAKEQGTSTLQECKDHITREFQKAIKEGLTDGQKEELVNKTLLREPVNIRTFSLVMRSGNIVPLVSSTSLQIDSENWHTGKASESSFRYLDIETATNGEYWMLFRGFLLLQRDAMSGRFAAQRAGGFGSMYNNYEIMHQLKAAEKNANENNPVPIFDEPEERGQIKKLMSFFTKSDDKDKDIHNPKAPPSDFFLGFRSPGTQIWGRLRQAGLETDRIYALDTKCVMIKVRCPTDRLMDVAEVLRLKMKTNDGYYATFREDMIEAFQIADDSESCLDKQGSSLFRSSDRQRILDFIINSRIRDSGAQLSGHNDLGKNIMCRAPIHMHAKLEAIYDVWVHFYRKCNWNKGKMSIETNIKHIKDDHIPPPSFLKRLIVGSFYQPLDSVEEYFGEKVALYFAWLEHSSIHLILLSVLGLFAFFCQVVSGRFDHEIRPYFSFVVQIWSFFVLVMWRKRQNSLTYHWGSTNYKEEETPRPQFRGEYKRCDITGEVIAYYPRWKRWLKYLLSVPLTLSITVAALCGILLFYANRDIVLARYFSDPNADGETLYEVNWSLGALNQKEALGAVELSKEHLQDINFWYIVAGAPSLLGLTLPLVNFLLMQISRKMNDFENHETESHYRNGLIVKVIAFRFVAYFAALYYYAYISTGADQATVDNSILRVATSLVIYLTVAHWWSIFLGVYVPLLILRWRLYRGQLKLKTELRFLNFLERTYCNDEEMTAEEAYGIEKMIVNKRILLEQAQSKIWEEMMLPEYDPFFDYVQAIIHFAYVACFSAVFPLTPILVLGNQLINMRLHAYKICRSRRRPLAQKTGGIGVWAQLLHIVTVIAILTNCSLMVLTSSVFDFVRDTYGSLGVFIVIVSWEHVMLLIKYMMESLISPFSSSILDAMKKEDYTRIEERNSNLRDKTKERRSSHGVSMFSRPRLGRNNSSMFTLSDDDATRAFHDEKRSFSSRTPAPKINIRKASFPPSPATEESSPLLDHYSHDEVSTPTDNRNINIEKNGLQHRQQKGAVDVRSMKKSPSRSIFLSPFNHFFQNEKYTSPFENKEPSSNQSPNVEDSPSLADMLSTGSFGTNSEVETKSFRTPLKPSMSRAKLEHIATSEQHAAEHRIQKRISTIRERRKTEDSRR